MGGYRSHALIHGSVNRIIPGEWLLFSRQPRVPVLSREMALDKRALRRFIAERLAPATTAALDARWRCSTVRGSKGSAGISGFWTTGVATERRPCVWRRNWAAGYPQMADVETHLAIIEEYGYEPAGRFTLPESSWLESFYDHLARRMAGYEAPDDESRLLVEAIRSEGNKLWFCSFD